MNFALPGQHDFGFNDLRIGGSLYAFGNLVVDKSGDRGIKVDLLAPTF